MGRHRPFKSRYGTSPLIPRRWPVQFCNVFTTPILLYLTLEMLINKKWKPSWSTSPHNHTAAKDTNPIFGEIIIIINLNTYQLHRQRKNWKGVCSIWRNLQFLPGCEYDKNEVPKHKGLKTPQKTGQIKLSFPLKSPSPNC